MIWYLLYFLRGTTEPPVLASSHPIRRAFTRYGNQSARHPVITLLISITVGTILIYPFPFLYTNNFTAGASNLPHHVWTTAQPFEGNPNTRADVAMRSVWVHGDYMNALHTDVLRSAMEIQDELLGPTADYEEASRDDFSTFYKTKSTCPPTREMKDSNHVVNGLSNHSWFFHSPLQYWGNSYQAIANDKDLLETVNEACCLVTAINITLRHTLCFSGKRYEKHRLVAADAVVITLVHMLDAPVGELWTQRARSLATKAAGKWSLYPSDGVVTKNKIYDFRFQPLSLHDDLILGIAYVLTTMYFIVSMSKLRALKSRFGLICAVCTQIGISIFSSFTICAIFKIDLSSIPREAYPLVVLTIGLENMFRLINAVIVTPAQHSTASRIGEALGVTGHIALAGVAQNLCIVWTLSKIVSPGVAAFCTFAAVALTFDFFFLLVFFVAVLSVEVRRTELGDTLHRASLRYHASTDDLKRQTWQDSFLQGKVPASTRVAGTAVMIGFILACQWHFFDQESPLITLSRFSKLWSSEDSEEPSAPINQVRTPTAWLRLQDHETAREVIQLIKPNASSYLARVYDPLIFVLAGADRTPSGEGVRMFLPAVYDFVKYQSTPFIVFVVVVVSLISLLMNYLLWNEIVEDEDDHERPEDGPLLGVKTLSRGHLLDVIILAASPSGIVASYGLDRRIRIWDIKHHPYSYAINTTAPPVKFFSVADMTIDKNGKWLGLVSTDGQIVSWNIEEHEWTPLKTVALKGRPLAFFYGASRPNGARPALTLVQQNGYMTDIEPGTCVFNEIRICKSALVSAVQWCPYGSVDRNATVPRILTASRHGCVHVATAQVSGDNFRSVEVPLEDATAVTPLPALGCFLVSSPMGIRMVDINNYTILHTFEMEAEYDPRSLRTTHSKKRPAQIGVGITRFSMAYTEVESGDLVLLSFDPEMEHKTVSLRDRGLSGKSCTRNTITQKKFRVQNPGTWELTDAGIVIGVRKVESRPIDRCVPDSCIGSLRQRTTAAAKKKVHWHAEADEDSWEVWSLSSKGERASMPLCRDGIDDNMNEYDSHLLVTSLGPMTRIGRRSIGVVLGNVIKVISVGHERFETGDENPLEDVSSIALTSRRKRAASARRNSGI